MFTFVGSPSAPVNLQTSQAMTFTPMDSITVQLAWSPPLNNDDSTSYQVTVNNATEVMYSDGTMAFVMLNSSGEYHVNITALNCAGSSPPLSEVIKIADTATGVWTNRDTIVFYCNCCLHRAQT